MVPPVINRVRGKTKERRHRAERRLKKLNASKAGKIPPTLVVCRGKGDIGISKKKQKKLEQRQRLLKQGKSNASNSTKMED